MPRGGFVASAGDVGRSRRRPVDVTPSAYGDPQVAEMPHLTCLWNNPEG